MGKIKVWKYGQSGEPNFGSNFSIEKKCVLQVTDIKTNRNKYYAIELHNDKKRFRVFTHYGRTDDLNSNPEAGIKETRYFTDLSEANATYSKIYKEKTSSRKGYKEINLASSNIGSSQARGKSTGDIDAKTLKKISNVKVINKSQLHGNVQEFVSYIYSEATNALTSTINANITAKGIETPLGVLTLGQIDKGQNILDNLWQLFQAKSKTKAVKDDMVDLSGEFYTAIPHRFGRSRASANEAVIDTLDKFNSKQETLQLMRDMLNVNGDVNVLFESEIDKKYDALGCKIDYLEPGTKEFSKIKSYVEKSQLDTKHIKVKHIYAVSRNTEEKEFNSKIGNEKLLFHGSGAKNWVGILSRGLLLPKIVVSLGGHRTDAGWLGNGIYFGDAVCTTLTYTYPGKRGTRIITVANVALGKIKKYTKITYGIKEPPKGYDSCHGVRSKGNFYSEFDDDEFVIYSQNQQKLQYVVEYTG